MFSEDAFQQARAISGFESTDLDWKSNKEILMQSRSINNRVLGQFLSLRVIKSQLISREEGREIYRDMIRLALSCRLASSRTNSSVIWNKRNAL